LTRPEVTPTDSDTDCVLARPPRQIAVDHHGSAKPANNPSLKSLRDFQSERDVSEAATDHVPRTGDDVDEDGITLQIEFASGLL
jgi:hypothetical protein